MVYTLIKLKEGRTQEMFRVVFKRNGKQFTRTLAQVDAYILMAQPEIEVISMMKVGEDTKNGCFTVYAY